MAPQVNSWVGHGTNEPVQPGQLGSALGQDVLGQLSQRTGMSQQELLNQLSAALPQIINHLTPNGRMPTLAELEEAKRPPPKEVERKRSTSMPIEMAKSRKQAVGACSTASGRCRTGQSSPFKRQPSMRRRSSIYDGDCGFCAYWARYWEQLTGERVEYRPYQQALPQYRTIPEAEFQRAVQFIAPDGRRPSGAEASFLTLAHAPGKGFWLALYRYLPGFAPVAEFAYAAIAKRRPAFFRLSLMLWGRSHEPPRHELVSFLFLRLFGLVTLSAFLSFAVQAQGLIGSRGILPLSELVEDALARFRAELASSRRWCSG